MKRLGLSLVVALLLGFAATTFAFETDLIVDGALLGSDLLYGGPGGIFLGGDGFAAGGDVDFDLGAGGNGMYFDVGFGVSDFLTGPFLSAFAAYSDLYGDNRVIGLVVGLAVAFHSFATVQTDGLTWAPPFRLTDFDLFARIDLDVGGMFDLMSDLTAYVEFDVAPDWQEGAFTPGARWAFGFAYQWTDVFVPKPESNGI